MSGPNVENIRTWVAALRSDRFKQGRTRLVTRDHNGDVRHCCLGVGSVLACEAGVELELHWIPNSSGTSSYKDEVLFAWSNEGGTWRERSFLPGPVADWLGIDTMPSVDGDKLTAHNDTGSSFAGIADLIEAEWVTPKGGA